MDWGDRLLGSLPDAYSAWEFEPSRAGGAGIEQESRAEPLGLRLMRVAEEKEVVSLPLS
jgi:hypothetical protein